MYLCAVHSNTEENYLKAIYKLGLHSLSGVSTNDIAAEVKTKAASVTDMLKRLASKKLISYKKYQGVKLTGQGKKIALLVIRKHRLWEFFLVNTLKFKWDEVHEIAEQLEHIQSQELINRVDDFLGRPKSDPHGDAIPDRNGKIPEAKSLALSKVTKGNYLIHGVLEHSQKFLRYLEKLKLLPGQKIKLTEINEYDGSVLIVHAGKKIFMGTEAANKILVTNY